MYFVWKLINKEKLSQSFLSGKSFSLATKVYLCTSKMKIKVEPTQFKLDKPEESRDETTILMDQTGTNKNEQDQSSLIKIELLEKRIELLEFQELNILEILVKTLKIVLAICILLSFVFIIRLIHAIVFYNYLSSHPSDQEGFYYFT